MPKLTFCFDEEKDLWNNWTTVKSGWPSPESIIRICNDKDFEECKEELRKFYKKFYKSPLIKETKNSFRSSWNKINNEFFRRLEKITGNKFPFDNVTVYLTTQLRCPYDFEEGSFMVSIFSNLPSALKTAGHELMHLDFHVNNWDKISKQIGNEKTSALKEALTILLNLEFRDLWFVRDKGRKSDSQQILRRFIEKEWIKEKNYNLLLEKCVDFLK